MNCKDCQDKLDQFVDRELSDEELVEVRRHLEECPPCEDLYRLQVNMRRVVKVCCDQGVAPEHLRSRLRQILY